MPDNKQKTGQWLSVLFYLQLCAIGLTLLNQLSLTLQFSLGGSWITWVRRGVNIGIVACLFLLPGHYRPAAASKGIWLVFSILPSVLSLLFRPLGMDLYVLISSITARITTVLALLALYLEYRAHADTGAAADRSKWILLWTFNLVLTLGMNLLLPLLQDNLNTMLQNGITWGLTVYNLIVLALTLTVDILYLILLSRTVQNARNEEHTYG